MKKLAAVLMMAAAMASPAQAQVTQRIVPSQGETMTSDPEGAFGVIVLGNYAIECMSRKDPLRTQTMDTMARLTLNFTQAEVRAARTEVGTMIKQGGKEQFCRTVEEAMKE